MYTLGIDIGSTTSKCVILKDGAKEVAKSLIVAGTGTDGPNRALNEVLKKANLKLEDVSYIVSTGYGRKGYRLANTEISELSCHAKGVMHLFPKVRTIIDIGGQDAKVLSINERGRLAEFVMNDKCAAGTGRFLDVMANVLKLDISDLEKEARKATNPVQISSTCTVFAESEVISQLSNGSSRENVVAGICKSVANRVATLAKRLDIKDEVFMSGGVAKNEGVRNAMEEVLNTKIVYSKDSQLMGALGAALFAYEKSIKEE